MALSRPNIPIWPANSLREIPGRQRRHVHAGQQHRVSARDLCRRHPIREAQFPRPRHLPRLYASHSPHFCRSDLGTRTHAERDAAGLAAAIIECIDAGARVINLSLALAQPSTNGEQSLEEALNQAVKRGVIVVAAAGNQGTLGSSAITRHPWVIPVVACDFEADR